MGFWKFFSLEPSEQERRMMEASEAARRRQSVDIEALSRGELLTLAKERLLKFGKTADQPDNLFSSNLSPDELALLGRHGYRVRGVVTGSAMYNIGLVGALETNFNLQYSDPYDREIYVLSSAYNKATELAVSRLQQEANFIGAHTVVGVRFLMKRHDWAENVVEVQVVGTAIEEPGRRISSSRLSDLSGQEFWSLIRAGYEPAALVWGHCSWLIITTYGDEYSGNRAYNWQNTELTHRSQAMQDARDGAMRSIISLAHAAKASGVVAVKIDRELNEVRIRGAGENPVYEREHHILTFSIIGTAISPRPGASPAVSPTINILSLRDGRIKPAVVQAPDAAVVD